jgi:hypothetical protein
MSNCFKKIVTFSVTFNSYKVIEISGFTIENEKLSIWIRNAYLNSNDEIEYHQELYFIEEINYLHVNVDWLKEFGFIKGVDQFYYLSKGNELILGYDFNEKKVGCYTNNSDIINCWINCNYVNKLQNFISLWTSEES